MSPPPGGATEQWRCELSSGSVLKRKGWTTDLFAKGTEITIVGSPARNEATACYTETITFANGTRISRRDELDESGQPITDEPVQSSMDIASASVNTAIPDLSGTWISELPDRRPPPQNGAPRPERPGADEERNDTAQRPAREPRGRGPQVELTEAGKAAVEGFQREDNPRFQCQATNILLDWWFDQLVNQIEQSNTDITLRYGFMDLVRTIHLDLDEHPEQLVPDIAGHSIGKWEDGVLIVDTTGFAEGYLHVPPNADEVIRNSTDLHIVERFSLSDDGTTLTREYVAEDPSYLVGTFSGQDVVKRTSASYEAYDCEDLTGDTY